jgi:hypothetical protein
MIVRMTRQQSSAIQKVVAHKLSMPQAKLVMSAFEENTTTASKHRVDVMMPACYWRGIENVLFDTVYDVRGFKVRDIGGPLTRGHRAIRAALNVRESHPALLNIAVLGRVHELLPVWNNVEYSVYPTQNSTFSVLAPTVVKIGANEVTKWVEAPQLVGSRPILTEATHLAFSQ